MNGPDPLRASRDRLVDEAADLDAHGKPAEARAAVRARLRKEIDDLDYRRSLRILGERGYTQVRIAAYRLEGSALPLPASSSAVPWSTATRG